MTREHKIPSIRLNEIEEDKMYKLMQQHNVSKTQLVRQLIMNAKLKPPVIDKVIGTEMLRDIRKTGADINKLGGNVNQISKFLNKQKDLDKDQLERLNTNLLTIIELQQEMKAEVEKQWQQLSTLLLTK